MNKTYRSIWNAVTHTWTAAAETAKSHSKGSSRAARQAVIAIALGSAAIGSAAAADMCTTEEGVSGMVDAAGACKVAHSGTIGTMSSVGTMAALDDTYFKVNSTGAASVASTTDAIAIGPGASVINGGTTNPSGSIAIGSGATAGGSGSIMIGTNARHSGSSATVVGSNASAMGGGAGTALGTSSSAAGNGSVALGSSTTASGRSSIALGTGSVADAANTVSVGNSTTQRKIVNMAAGNVSATSTDAVNGAQLHGVADSVASAIGGGSTVNADGSISAPSFTVGDGSGGSKIVNSIGDAVTNLDGRTTTNEGAISKLADELSSGTLGLVQQTSAGADLTVGANTDGAAVNFAGTAGTRKLTGITAGDVSAASTDAVNGSQLHGVSDSVASAIGGGTMVNPDGSISAPSFTVGDGSGGSTTVHSIGDVVTNLDGRTTTNEGAISKLADQLGSGTIGLVQQEPTSGAITVGAGVGGSTVNFAGSGGLRTLSGVANGVGDDDVVTVSQLRATGLIDYTGKEVGAVTYDSGLSFDSVTFAGSNGTVLHRVGAGEISATSMDAVNGSQLYALQERFGELSGRVDDLSDRLGDVEADPGTGPGTGAPGTGEGSTIVGEGADASGKNGSAIGNGAVASGDNSSAIGQGSVASGDNSSAIGQGSVASGSNSSAIGQGSVASGNNSSAVGQGSVASGNNAVALGTGSVADRDNAVSVGSAGNERQITNVAAGTAPTDAVNLQQMNNAVSSARQDAMGGVAAAMAVAGLPQSTQPGRTFMAMGASTYGGEYGTAMGLSYMTRDGKWTVKAAVNTSSRGEVGGVIGGGFYW
ncbi:ESPR-type extended signal peptide-containing protein [Burkholderia sp. BCCCDS16]|uniref:ESPR-type extended signal peptide-containing protein n=2 Tax=Bacteria TaxID=2 RepID=UPI003D2EDA3C